MSRERRGSMRSGRRLMGRAPDEALGIESRGGSRGGAAVGAGAGGVRDGGPGAADEGPASPERSAMDSRATARRIDHD
jgi:hypothetical protein